MLAAISRDAWSVTSVTRSEGWILKHVCTALSAPLTYSASNRTLRRSVIHRRLRLLNDVIHHLGQLSRFFENAQLAICAVAVLDDFADPVHGFARSEPVYYIIDEREIFFHQIAHRDFDSAPEIDQLSVQAVA